MTLPDPEALLAAMAHRRSMGLSRLLPDPVDPALIDRMLRAADWAPSHGETEPWRFTVFTGEGRTQLADLYGAAYLAGAGDSPDSAKLEAFRQRAFAAPLWIAIGLEPGRREDGSLKMSEEDEGMAVACAVQNLHLMASAQGLAGMWHSKGVSVHPAVAQGLGLEEPARLLGFFLAGWPNCDWPEGDRRPLEEKVRWVID